MANNVAFLLGWFMASWRPMLWSLPMAAAGVLCIANAARCRRLQCHFTGPLFLLAALLTFLHATNVLSFSWNLFGIAVVAGTAFAYGLELVLNKYAPQPTRTMENQ